MSFTSSVLRIDTNSNDLGRWFIVLELSREIFISLVAIFNNTRLRQKSDANQSENNSCMVQKLPIVLAN